MNGSHQTTKQSDNHLCHDATIALAHAQNVLLQESHGHFCKALDAVQNPAEHASGCTAGRGTQLELP